MKTMKIKKVPSPLTIFGFVFVVNGLIFSIAGGSMEIAGRGTADEQAMRVVSFCFVPLGIFLVLLGGVFLWKNVHDERRIARLKAGGRKVYGKVTHISMNTSVRVNGRCPFYLECTVEDPYTGAICLYRSGNIMNDISLFMDKEVLVYVDPQNLGNYYVDVDSLYNNPDWKIYDFR